jgi:hypothetical protein
MTDWRTLLREVDARNETERLSADDADSMRRAMLAAAAENRPEAAHGSWMRPLLVAATVVAMIAGGIMAGRRLDLQTAPENPVAQVNASVGSPTAGIAVPNRQLQFLTPGGTRIIWVFNSDFDLKATVR